MLLKIINQIREQDYFIKKLLEENGGKITDIKEILEAACNDGNIDIVNTLINSDLNIHEDTYISILYFLISYEDCHLYHPKLTYHKDDISNNDIDIIKLLISKFDYNKSDLETLFFALYSFYAIQKNTNQIQLDYLKFLIELFFKLDISSNKEIMNDLNNKNYPYYNFELINLLNKSKNIIKF